MMEEKVWTNNFAKFGQTNPDDCLFSSNYQIAVSNFLFI